MRPALFLATMAAPIVAGFLAVIPANASDGEVTDALKTIIVWYGVVTLVVLALFALHVWLSEARRRRRMNDRYEQTLRELESPTWRAEWRQ